MRLHVSLLWAVLSIASAIGQSQELPKFDSDFDFRLRHPALAAREEFRTWMRSDGGIGAWFETTSPDLNIQVNVPSKDEKTALVAEVSDIGAEQVVLGKPIVVPLAKFLAGRPTAMSSAYRQFPNAKILAVRPRIVLLPQGADVLWQIDEQGDTYKTLIFNKDGLAAVLNGGPAGAVPSVPPPEPCNSTRDDSITKSNDLHHTKDFPEATTWVQGVSDINERARIIARKVRLIPFNYSDLAHDFTLSDLVSSRLHTGMCDEYAVMAVTYLRSLDIPAVIKFLTLEHRDPTKRDTAHACVEYKNGNDWIHLDATAGRINAKGMYRDDPDIRDVRVEDVNWPDDRRFTSSHDPDGDGILTPDKDLCRKPLGGERRAGYSF
jgi:hypothetical protein